MSYIVLARKWRPQTFEDVIGQQPIVRTLQNALRANRVSQAFLFAGPRGVGKTSVARILAKALNCETGPTATPCNQCDACLEITKTIAPDVFEIDGASNTGVDHVRDLQETIKYLPQKHRYKIFIVDEVHMLSTPAFNAFLKTLEEPPSHVVFIFATTEPHKIIKTVVDRCQRYDFKKITTPIIVEHLNTIAKKEGITVSPQSLQLIARDADGSLRDGQSMLDQIVTYAGTTIEDRDVTECLGIPDRTILASLVSAVLNGRLDECLDILCVVFDHGIDIRHFYRGLVEYFRNLAVAKVSVEPQLFPDLQAEEINDLVKQSSGVTLELLRTILNVLIESEGLLYRAALPRVVIEALVLRIATLPRGSSLKDVVDRLALVQDKLMGREGPMSAVGAAPNVRATADEEGGGQTDPGNSEGVARAAKKRGASRNKTAAGKHSQASAEEAWAGLVAFVRHKKPLIASLLDHGKMLKIDEKSLRIKFPAKSIYLESMNEEGMKRELTRLCEQYFASPRSIVILEDSPSGSPDDMSASLTKAQRNEKIRDEARKHPLIREALDVFGGGIAEIKVNGD